MIWNSFNDLFKFIQEARTRKTWFENFPSNALWVFIVMYASLLRVRKSRLLVNLQFGN